MAVGASLFFYLYSLSISVLLAVISLFVESIFFTLAFCLPIFQQTSTEKIELQVTRNHSRYSRRWTDVVIDTDCLADSGPPDLSGELADFF